MTNWAKFYLMCSFNDSPPIVTTCLTNHRLRSTRIRFKRPHSLSHKIVSIKGAVIDENCLKAIARRNRKLDSQCGISIHR